MLTVRIIRADGSEWIEEASSVSLNTAKQSASGRQSFTFFTIGKDKNYHQEVYDGHIYVMNDGGKTVGSYELGTLPIEEQCEDKLK